MSDERPGLAETLAAATAGAAFAGSAIFLRGATLVPPRVFDGLALAIVAFGLAPALARWIALPVGTFARGSGLAGGSLIAATALVPPFDRAALPIALWMGAATFLQAEARLRRRNVWLLLAGALLALAGTAVAAVFASAFPSPEKLRVVVIGATLAAALALVARAQLLRGRWSALAPRPVGILLVCALGAAYLGYRGAVATKVENLPLYEWTLGVGVASLVLARVRRGARETATPEAWSSEARRHAQDVAPVYDARMAPLAAAVQRYLETGTGFDEYRAVLKLAHPDGPTLRRIDALRPSTGRNARDARYRSHAELTPEAQHGHTPAPSRVRAHP